MVVFVRTVGAFMAGSLVTAIITPRKVARTFYAYETRPDLNARLAARELLDRVGERPAGENDDSWRAVASREFAKDLARMKWTWNREINWEDARTLPTANPPP